MSVQCSHYLRKCLFKTECCKKFYQCRFCHDDKEDHELDRLTVSMLKCMQCAVVQPLAVRCRECSICFGMYSCLKCRLFDDTDKQQFHCNKCKTCRVGGAENFYHCDNCGICLAKDLAKSHRCRTESGKDVCPVCFEDVHSSTEPAFVPQCSHLIHMHCYRMVQRYNIHRCPYCNSDYNITQNNNNSAPQNIYALVDEDDNIIPFFPQQ